MMIENFARMRIRTCLICEIGVECKKIRRFVEKGVGIMALVFRSSFGKAFSVSQIDRERWGLLLSQ